MNLYCLECFIELNNKVSLCVVECIGVLKEGVCRKWIFGCDVLFYSIIV